MNSDKATNTGSWSRVGRLLIVAAKVVCVILALLGVYFLLATFVLHGPVNERSLFQSVSAAARSPYDQAGPCIRGNQTWSCTVLVKGGSGSGRYRVSVHPDSSCWDAVLVLNQSRDEMPRTLSGCVRRLEWSWF